MLLCRNYRRAMRFLYFKSNVGVESMAIGVTDGMFK
jgi:hypothetical protein